MIVRSAKVGQCRVILSEGRVPRRGARPSVFSRLSFLLEGFGTSWASARLQARSGPVPPVLAAEALRMRAARITGAVVTPPTPGSSEVS